ncbi:MAG: hypothetical protein JRI66_13230 [Deltaproteobacteria bacterium]|nr:hypothetical protein [Deltaproteobacteria bacterium]
MRCIEQYPGTARYGLEVQICQIINGIEDHLAIFRKYFFTPAERDEYIKWLRYTPGYLNHRII